MNFHWPESSIDRLKAMYADGASMREIAKEIGATRNAVIGKVHRLKLTRENNPPRSRKPARGDGGIVTAIKCKLKRQAKEDRPRRPLQHQPIFPREPPPVPATDDLTRTAHSVTLLGLTNDTCRWPCGEPSSADFFYCGRPEADLDAGRPYCRSHQSRATARV